MIPRYSLALCAILALGACDGGNPFEPIHDDEVDGGTGEDGDPVTPIDSDGDLPPGTESPSSSSDITRREERGEGSGYVERVSYNSETDTFTVDNLAFDGDPDVGPDTDQQSTYRRSPTVATLDPVPTTPPGGQPRESISQFAVYEPTEPVPDPLNGDQIDQFLYRAVYGVSPSGQSEFAIVRTGSYIPYGFGGFIYQRNGNVEIPQTGQGSYKGEYAGLRDFDGRGGLEYTTGRATVQIDFEDFNQQPNTIGDGVNATIFDRRVFDLAGNDITAEIAGALEEGRATLPEVRMVINDSAAKASGEIVTDVFSRLPGESDNYEDGQFFAVLSGEDAEEITGIVVLTSQDPRFENVTARETGGFIVYRRPEG